MNNTGRVYVRGQLENSQAREQRLTDNYFKRLKGLKDYILSASSVASFSY